VGPVEQGIRQDLLRIPLLHQEGGLAQLAVVLAEAIDFGPEDKDLAALSGRLQAVLTELAKFKAPGAKGGKVDDLNARRQKRRGA
jgi:hypothetical protein